VEYCQGKKRQKRKKRRRWLASQGVYYLGSSWYRISFKKMLAQVNECFIVEKLDDEKLWRALGKYKKENKKYRDIEATNNISIIHLFN
jgi:hypothetical protein